MKTCLYCSLALFMFSALSVLFSAEAMAQSSGVELVFANGNPISLVAGEQVCFQLVAKDANGNVITDWSSSGTSVLVRVTNTIVDVDTLIDSWNRHPDGYSWSKLVVAGQTMTVISPHEFIVPNSLFTGGVADACYQATLAEEDIRITVTPTVSALNQISPPITYTPAALDNYLVELTPQCWPLYDDFYAHRPFEFIVSPRDRFLNRIKTDIPVRIEAKFPAELDSVPGTLPNPFDPALTVNVVRNFFLRPNAERERALVGPHRIHAYHPADASINGSSDPFFAIPHAPLPFVLQLPADQTTLHMSNPNDTTHFYWEKPLKPDPYTDIQISRYSGAAYSDSMRYRIFFADTTNTQRVAFDALLKNGLPYFEISHSALAAVVDQIAGTPHVPAYELKWFIEASDGDYTTMSTPVAPGIPGHRLTVLNEMFSGKGVGSHFAAYNPVPMPAGGEVLFELQALENGSFVEEWNESGGDVLLRVKGSTAENDTSTRSWNGNPDAYSWARLTVNGQDIPPSAPHEYMIPKTSFANGRAAVTYRTSKAEKDIRLEIEPSVQGLDQSSPALTWKADTLENFLVEITWHDPTVPGVFIQRPFELIITPRDRYLNTIEDDVTVRLSSYWRIDVDPMSGDTSEFSDPHVLKGQTALYLLATTPADVHEGHGERIYLSHQQLQLHAASAEFSVMRHPPLPFELGMPSDSTTLELFVSHWEHTFDWEHPIPPDAVTNILVSRFTSQTISDDVRYTVHFRDHYFPSRSLTFPADNDGRDAKLTLTEGSLAGIIDSFAQDPLAVYRDVLWFVEATDGLYITHSTDQLPTLPGNRLRLTKHIETQVHPMMPSQVSLSHNYPNPFNPSTTISFTTTRRGAVSLQVFDLLGREIATIHSGMLDAGEHSVLFDASKLRSGVYVYRLDAEGKSMSRRMVVMK
jgi:hypothetical protein